MPWRTNQLCIAYECSIAMMQACNEVYLNRGENTPKALYGLSHTVNQVRERLESPDALSDSTITMVLSLINQEQMKQCHTAAKVHLQGLRKMIELRGGLEQLEGNISLVLKACKYVFCALAANSSMLHPLLTTSIHFI